MTVDRKKIVKPIHPGEILREEFLIPLNLSPIQLSKEIKVPKELVEWVYEERGDITVDLATRFSLFFGTSAEMWMNFQKAYEQDLVNHKIEELKGLIVPYDESRKNLSC